MGLTSSFSTQPLKWPVSEYGMDSMTTPIRCRPSSVLPLVAPGFPGATPGGATRAEAGSGSDAAKWRTMARVPARTSAMQSFQKRRRRSWSMGGRKVMIAWSAVMQFAWMAAR